MKSLIAFFLALFCTVAAAAQTFTTQDTAALTAWALDTAIVTDNYNPNYMDGFTNALTLEGFEAAGPQFYESDGCNGVQFDVTYWKQMNGAGDYKIGTTRFIRIIGNHMVYFDAEPTSGLWVNRKTGTAWLRSLPTVYDLETELPIYTVDQ